MEGGRALTRRTGLKIPIRPGSEAEVLRTYDRSVLGLAKAEPVKIPRALARAARFSFRVRRGVGDTEEVDSEEVDSEEVDSEEVDSEEVDSEEVDSEEVDSEEVDSEEVDSAVESFGVSWLGLVDNTLRIPRDLRKRRPILPMGLMSRSNCRYILVIGV